MLTRFETETILAQLVWERSQLDRQIAELESAAPQPRSASAPHITVICMDCRKIYDPTDDRWRSEPHPHSPHPVSHGLCPECLDTRYSDSL